MKFAWKISISKKDKRFAGHEHAQVKKSEFASSINVIELCHPPIRFHL